MERVGNGREIDISHIHHSSNNRVSIGREVLEAVAFTTIDRVDLQIIHSNKGHHNSIVEADLEEDQEDEEDEGDEGDEEHEDEERTRTRSMRMRRGRGRGA